MCKINKWKKRMFNYIDDHGNKKKNQDHNEVQFVFTQMQKQ